MMIVPTVLVASLLPLAPTLRYGGPATSTSPSRSRSGLLTMSFADNSGSSSWESSLRKGMASSRHEKVQFGPASRVMRDVDMQEAWVLLFNPADPQEGVYTLQGQNHHKRHKFLVAFANHDDASRFGCLLEAQDFDVASPTCWTNNEVTSFCATADFDFAYVPPGALLLPPSKNVYDDMAFEDFGLQLHSENDRTLSGMSKKQIAPQSPEGYGDTRDWLESLLHSSDSYESERSFLESCLKLTDEPPVGP